MKKNTLVTILLTFIFLIINSHCFCSNYEYKIIPLNKNQLATVKSLLHKYNIIESGSIKSKSHNNSYYICVVFKSKYSNVIMKGTWFINFAGYRIFSIDNMAYIHTKMGRACKTKARACEDDNEVKALKEHFEY